MKRAKTKYDDSESPVFITSSITSQINVFSINLLADNAIRILEDVRKEYDMKIFAFCLMPSHIHLIIQSVRKGDVSNFMREWKSITARNILNFAKEKSPQLLKQFEEASVKYHLSSKQKYHVWEARFDDLQLKTKETTRIKMNYIHENPVKKEIVEIPEQYMYSSAGWYDGTGESRVRLTDIRELLE